MTAPDGPEPPNPPSRPSPAAAKPASPAAAKPARPATGAATRKPRRRQPAPPPPPPRRWTLLAGVAVLTLSLDQLVKWVVVQHLDLPMRHAIDLIDPWLNLRMAWNQGMNFGLLASSQDLTRWLLISIALAICIWIVLWIWRNRPGRFAHVAAGLLIGGALGNVIDRLAYGAVADFLNMSLPGWRNPYSFNIADIAIFAGALGLIFHPGGQAAAPAGGQPAKAGKGGKAGTGSKTGRPGAGDSRAGTGRARKTASPAGKATGPGKDGGKAP